MTKITKTSDTSLDAAQCGLNSFLDLLPQRTPLLGQCSVSYERFRRVHLRDLRPVAALECTVAENLIANEWELQQLRRMLNRVYAHILADQIEAAAFKTLKQTHEDKLDEDWQAWVSSGKNQEDWEEEPFDLADAEAHAAELAQLARSTDPQELSALEARLDDMGIDVVHLMAHVQAESTRTAHNIANQIRNLEKRRREIKADFDALQKASSIRATMEAIEDAEIVE